MKKNLLVTGGSGRLGSYLCPFLQERGYNVANFDQVPPQMGTPLANVPFIKGDFSDLGECMRAISIAQPDVIIHLAALASHTELLPFFAKEYDTAITTGYRPMQRLPEDTTMRVNTMGTFYIFDAARRMGVKDIIFASSYFTLGIGFRLSGTSFEPAYLPIDENHPNLPEDSYSLSKVLGEEIAKSFARAYGIRSIGLRFLGVYFDYVEMSRKNREKEFGATVPQANEKELNMLTGKTYQYVDARDIALAIDLAINKIGSPEFELFEPFFLSTDTLYPEPTTEVIAKRWPNLSEMGKDIKGTDGMISNEKAKRMLGFYPQHSWRDKK